jgi:hypothetical protein
MTIFSKTQKEKQNDTKNTNGETKENKPLPKTANTNTNIAENFEKEPPLTEESPTVSEHELILDANQAIEDVSAIPLYFPTSYSLVKPYIQGFEINTLDAHSLKNVKINNSWQPKKKNGES